MLYISMLSTNNGSIHHSESQSGFTEEADETSGVDSLAKTHGGDAFAQQEQIGF